MSAGCDDHARVAKRRDLAIHILRSMQCQCAGMPHAALRRCRPSDDTGYYRLLHADVAKISCRFLFFAAPNFTDQDDPFGLRVGKEQLQTIDKAQAVYRIAANTDGRRLPETGRCQLVRDLTC